MASVLEILIKPITAEFDKAIERVSSATKKVDRDLKKFDNTIRNVQAGLLSAGLAALFTGLALERVAFTALRAILKAYTDIVDANDAFNLRLLELRAGFEFLKFSIAEALSQSELFNILLDFLFLIIDKLNELSPAAKANIGLAIIFTFLFGKALAILGQILLGVIPLVGFFTRGLAALTASPVGTFFSGLVTAAGGLARFFGILALVVAFLVAAFQTNFGGLADFVKNTFGIILTTIGNVFKTIFAITKDVFALIKAVMTGDMNTAGKLILKIVLNLVRLIAVAFLGIAVVFANVLITLVNFAKEIFLRILPNVILSFTKGVVRLFQFLAQGLTEILATPINALLAKLRELLSFIASKLGKFGAPFQALLSVLPESISLGTEAIGRLGDTIAGSLDGAISSVNNFNDKFKIPLVTAAKFKSLVGDINASVDDTINSFAKLPSVTPTTAPAILGEATTVIAEGAIQDNRTITINNNVDISATSLDPNDPNFLQTLQARINELNQTTLDSLGAPRSTITGG